MSLVVWATVESLIKCALRADTFGVRIHGHVLANMLAHEGEHDTAARLMQLLDEENQTIVRTVST